MSESNNDWSKVINVALCILIFLLSVVIPPAYYRMYDPITKLFFLRAITFFLLAVWLLKMVWTRTISWIKSPLNLPLLMLSLAAILATVFSVNRHLSFYGFYAESEGLLTILNYFLLPLIVVNFTHRERDIHRIITIILISSVLVAIYGLAQYFGWGTIFTSVEQQEQAQLRAFSFLSNPLYFASYLVLVLPIAISLFVASTAPSRRWLYGGVIILLFASLLVTYSRSGWLAFLISILFLGWLIRETMFKNKKIIILLALSLILIVLAIIIAKIPQGGLSIIKQAAPLTELRVGTLATRLIMWKGIIRMTIDRPLFGWGLETLQLKFPRYSSPDLYKLEEYRLLSRAHNELLHVAATMGSFGLAAYLWLLFTLLKWGFKFHRLIQNKTLKSLLSGTLAGCIGYLAQMQFSFGVIAVTSLFWIIVGLIITLGVVGLKDGLPFPTIRWKFPKKLNAQFFKGAFSTVIIILFIFLFILALYPLVANYYEGQAKRYFQVGEWEKAFAAYRQAIRFNPQEEYYYNELGAKYYILALLVKDPQEKHLLLRKALIPLKKAKQIDPLAYAVHFNSANVYYSLALLGDKGAIFKAIESYKKAISIDPNYIRGYLYLAGAYQQAGLRKKAIQSFRMALKIDPQNEAAQRALRRLEKD